MQSKRKLALIALLLAVTCLFSGCALVKKDMAVDAATEIIKVADTVYTKAQVQQYVDAYLANMANSYYNNTGHQMDITDSSYVKLAQDAVIDDLVQQAVVDKKAAEYGLAPLSEEAQAEVDAQWQEDYDLIRSVFFSDVEVGDGEGQTTQEELDANIATYASYYLNASPESLAADKVTELLKSEVVKDVTVSDEEVTADFEAKVEDAKAAYATDLSAYGTAVNGGTETIYYRPAGYRMVKQILIRFLPEDQSRMDQLNQMITDQTTAVNTATTLLTSAGVSSVEDRDAMLEKVSVEMGEMDFTVATLTDIIATPTDVLGDEVDDTVKGYLHDLKVAQELKSKYESLLQDATEQAYARIADRADEVLARVEAGEDWDTLMAEYTEDPGMQGDRETAKNGYAICEGMSGMDEPFVTAAMALEKVGDVSPKTRSSAAHSYGYYIIKYWSDVAEGPVDLADVRDDIHSALLTTKQDDFYNTTVEQWVSDANAVIDRNSLNN